MNTDPFAGVVSATCGVPGTLINSAWSADTCAWLPNHRTVPSPGCKVTLAAAWLCFTSHTTGTDGPDIDDRDAVSVVLVSTITAY